MKNPVWCLLILLGTIGSAAAVGAYAIFERFAPSWNRLFWGPDVVGGPADVNLELGDRAMRRYPPVCWITERPKEGITLERVAADGVQGGAGRGPVGVAHEHGVRHLEELLRDHNPVLRDDARSRRVPKRARPYAR